MDEAAETAELLDLALAVAREAGALVTRMRAEGVEVADTKSSPIDIVTAADRACEELVRARVLAARPDDGFLGEEGEDVVGSSGTRWIVDPIDGTVNYLYGLPHWAVSVAVARDDRTVVGVVLAPALGHEYVATAGGGATCDGRPVGVRPSPPLSGSLVATGFGYQAAMRTRQGRAVARLLPQVRDVRRLGSCALDLCALASGQVDAYVEEGPHLWDHAAGALVATEAGAVVEVWTTPFDSEVVVAAPEAAWAAFSELVRDCGFPG